MSHIIQRGGMKLIFGFGLSGQSLARYCLRQSIPFHVVDTRDHIEKRLQLQTQLEAQDTSEYTVLSHITIGAALENIVSHHSDVTAFVSQFSDIFVSPGASLEHPLLICARQLQIPLTNDISLFMSELRDKFPQVKVVAITGSNGKSTVTDAVAFVGRQLGQRCHAVGNIGLPVLDILSTLQLDDTVVIELSSYQLQLVDGLGADIAVLLNVSEDHLDRHGTVQAYWAVKQKIYEKASIVVVNKDDPLSAPLAPHQESMQLKGYCRFGLGAPDLNDFGVIERGGQKWFAKGIKPLQPIAACALQGEQNIANGLVIFAIADALGWSLEAACTAWSQYQGLPFRCQIELTDDGIIWINDSKGTNVGASLVALRDGEARLGIDNGLWWIAGGLAKGAQFAPIASYLRFTLDNQHLRSVLLYGQDRGVIRDALEQENITVVHEVASLSQAVEWIKVRASQGDVVVFSPACASMDQFVNFEARGKAFSDAVTVSAH